MDFGNAIKQIRTSRGMNQTQLANLIGVSPSAISKIERDVNAPSRSMVKKICESLKISIMELTLLCMTEEDVPEKAKGIFGALKEPISNFILNQNNLL